MTDDLHNANDLLAEIEGLAIKTSAGDFVRTEDVRRLIENRQAANAVTESEAPKPKTLVEARAMATKMLKEKNPQLLNPPGRSIPASEPQSPSRA